MCCDVSRHFLGALPDLSDHVADLLVEELRSPLDWPFPSSVNDSVFDDRIDPRSTVRRTVPQPIGIPLNRDDQTKLAARADDRSAPLTDRVRDTGHPCGVDLAFTEVLDSDLV